MNEKNFRLNAAVTTEIMAKLRSKVNLTTPRSRKAEPSSEDDIFKLFCISLYCSFHERRKT